MASRLNARVQQLEKRLYEALGEQTGRQSGLGAPAAIDALNYQITLPGPSWLWASLQGMSGPTPVRGTRSRIMSPPGHEGFVHRDKPGRLHPS